MVYYNAIACLASVDRSLACVGDTDIRHAVSRCPNDPGSCGDDLVTAFHFYVIEQPEIGPLVTVISQLPACIVRALRPRAVVDIILDEAGSAIVAIDRQQGFEALRR